MGTNLSDALSHTSIAVTQAYLQLDEARKTAVQRWAEKHDIRPAEFAAKTGYSYNHAYQLIKGEAAVTAETLGRIMVAYGAQVMAEIEALAQDIPPLPETA